VLAVPPWWAELTPWRPKSALGMEFRTINAEGGVTGIFIRIRVITHDQTKIRNK
jgi:hypothetical protein